MSETVESLDIRTDSEQTNSISVPSENMFESMCMAIYAYQFGHIGFLDLIHHFDEMLGIPPLKIQSSAD